MKNYTKVLVFAAVLALIVVPAQAAGNNEALCELIRKMSDIFKILRVLAFAGAAFYMAAWAWDYIKGGKAEMDDLKKKGIGLLVGFTLLFIIGIVISAILAAAGQGGSLECEGDFRDWGK